MASDGDLLWPSTTVYDFAIKLKAYGKKSPAEWDAVSDFNGGMYVVWSNAQDFLRAVHIDHQGNELWRTDDIYSYGNCESPAIVPDGFGGIFLSWIRKDSSSKWGAARMVQRLNLSGEPQWGKNSIGTYAVKLFEHGSSPYLGKPEIRPDNRGGVIVESGMKLFHVDGDGKITDSISDLDPGASLGSVAQITSDGPAIVYPHRFDRGVYAAWHDNLKGEIHARKYHATNLNWNNAILVTKDDPGGFRLDYNFSFEMLIVWIGQSGTKISAQKFDANGNELWSPGGIVVADSLVDGFRPYIIAGAKADATLVWVDSRSGKPDLYAQRLDSKGVEQWTSGGELISKNIWNSGVPIYDESCISATSDGSSGVLIAYQTKSSTYNTSWNIVIDRLSLAANKLWSVKFDSDAFFDSPPYSQKYPKILFDNSGQDPTGAIVIFDDEQEGLCAQKIAVSN